MGTKTNLVTLAAGQKAPHYAGRKQAEAVTTYLIGDAIKYYAGRSVQRLLGYWVMVQAYESFAAYRDAGIVSRAGAYNLDAEFRAVFGVGPMEWRPDMAVRFPELLGKVALPFEDES